MNKFVKYLFAAAVAMLSLGAEAQQRVRIAGLENNPEYRALVAEEEELTRISDSISRSMNEVRRAFRTDTLNRSALTASILGMEEEIFDIRNRMARVTGRINAVEQEWILRSLGSEPPAIAAGNGTENAPGKISANLVYSSWFDLNLRPEDVRDLRRAQDEEASIPELAERFRENNGRLSILKYAYDLALTAGTADSIKTRFDSLSRVNRSLDAEIAAKWGTIFDNKSYAYNFLMDKDNRADMRRRYERDLEAAFNRIAEFRGVYASDAIPVYAVQKKLITGYEIMFARETGNEKALDSLRMAEMRLSDAGKLEGLAPVALTERLFLDFSDIEIHSSPQYSSAHPIPEVKIWDRGVIYRVLLGTYSSPQQPSVFRNAAPVAVLKGTDGKYRYFAGGFPDDASAKAAVEQLTGRGFRNPKAVVWADGVYIDPSETGNDTFYRIEMSGVHELSPEVKDVIRNSVGDRDILRTGNLFIVGPLDNAAEAVRLRTALEGRDPEIEIKITEIVN